MHGVLRRELKCPHYSCKRHTGTGFSCRENLNEQQRRVHDVGEVQDAGLSAFSSSDHKLDGLGTEVGASVYPFRPTANPMFSPKESFERQLVVRSPSGKFLTMSGTSILDTQSDVPHAVSRHWVREAGREAEISTDFKAPATRSLSGHDIFFSGIVRNMVFNIQGSRMTYRRDFYVCDQLEGVADFILGKHFIRDNIALLFGKAKKMIAGWFRHMKEKPGTSYLSCVSTRQKLMLHRRERSKNAAHSKPRAGSPRSRG